LQKDFAYEITLCECPMKRSKPHLKSMLEFMKFVKRKAIIRNKIMIHLGLSNPTINNQKSYTIEQWKAHKARHTLDKILFYLLFMFVSIILQRKGSMSTIKMNP
jgi:hypothetical protein